jgi:hypothetical protein
MPALPGIIGTVPRRAARFTGALLARIALRYQGQGYVYGGNADRPGNWDCSSFVSYVLHQAGLALPDGKWGQPGFPPNSHGPVVMDYALWAGAMTVGTPEVGDLCCWEGLGPDGHIGIAISHTEMISALNPTLGTAVTPIVGTGPAGARLIYRRITGVAGGGVLGVVAGRQASGASHPPLVVAAVVAGMLGAAFVGLVLAASGVAAAGTWAAAKAAGR